MTYRRYRSRRVVLRRAVGAALLAALALVAAGAAAQPHVVGAAQQQAVVADGVTVADVDLSGLTRPEVRAELEALASEPVVLTHGRRAWRFAPETLGARIDTAAATKAVLTASPGERVRMDVALDRPKLRRWLRRFAAGIDRKRQDAEIVLRGLRPHAIRARPGRKLFRSPAQTAVESRLLSHDREPVELQVKTLRPRVTTDALGPAIVIRRDSNRLVLYRGVGRKGMKVERRFRVATGMASYPTPLGNFTIVAKQRDPWWYPPDSDWAAGAEPVPPGPGNPLGTRWMGLSEPLIGIHGTPDAASIGYSASHGCIRMLVPEAEWLFERVPEGTPVFILGA